ncbi:hypothetical protein J6Y50_05525 [bacterium]|jgi:hypothetical protein|nr:hypothetical protein [bacterium]
MFKKMFTLLIAVLFVVPFVVAADDFDDDFGGDFEEEGEDAEEEEEEAPAKKKKNEEQSESDAAMKDLMGDPEDEKPAKEEKEDESEEADAEAAAPAKDGKAPAGKTFNGVKPVLLVKGGFTVFGSYKENGKSLSTMFGSLDEGIVGVEYLGKHVIAKGTLNIRTNYAFLDNGANPLAKVNHHSIQNGAANALYEVYGGVKFYDVFIKAGKLIPEYGLVDTWQNLGMGFTTPFLTKSLIAVEGFLPETDAGLALGYNGIIKKDHNVFVGLSLGTGANASEFWESDRTLGLYGRVGYGFKEYVKAAFAFQYRNDYYSGKKLDHIGIGVHINVAAKGFEMPITFDYGMMKMVKDQTARKSTTSMLLSLAPGYAYHFNHEWIDKVGLALRYDLVQGVYLDGSADYLDWRNYRSNSMVMRIGVTANFFTKELAGIRGMAGLTFLMQPESKVDKKDINGDGKTKDFGFTTIALQAGAEF